MVQPHGVVLEGCVPVGHGGMAGIAGFGEEAEVGEAKAAHEGQAGLSLLPGPPILGPGVQKHAQKQRRLDAEHGQADGGLPHEDMTPRNTQLQDSLHSMPFMMLGVIPGKASTFLPW